MPLNVDVNAINNAVMERVPGEPRTYLSADSAFQEGGVADNSMPQEYLNILDLPGMPIHNLTLKVGTPINLMRNLNFEAELCNGTRMIINTLKQRVVEATILTGTHAGNRAFIPRISLDSPASSGLPFTLRRRQFPFRSAFAMTINKSQGQSLSTVGLHFPNPVFAHGQLYVALSRYTDSHNLRVLLPPDSNGCTDNIVYKEVLT
jgi:ATP-dependent DNA helicase PIF1